MKKESKQGKRVYELAKELGLKSQNLMDIMQELGIPAKSTLSVVDAESASLISDYVNELKHKAKEQKEELESIPDNITLVEFCAHFGVPIEEVREKIMKFGLPYKPSYRYSRQEVHYLAQELGLKVPPFLDEEFKKRFVKRAPVVTVMGHVDHGKTTLLDTIRKTNVAAREKGQITQAIGASTVRIHGEDIIFIDTPGHEAFTEMRLRGSLVTDIVILVVAADEGVKEQTIESLNHAKAARVPIIVAVNKVDKPGADPEMVKHQLADRGLLPEEWGGQTVYVLVSAKTGQGIQDLLEIIRLQADLLDLKTNPNTIASGTVIESKIDKNVGPLATVIVQTGTLKVGTYLRAGNTVGKIRFLKDTFGKNVSLSPAVSAVEIAGLEEIPEAGEIFYELSGIEEMREEKEKIEEAKKKAKEEGRVPKTLEDLLKEMEEREEKRLYVILKADTQGSLEAVKRAISEIKSPIPIEIVHEGVGGIVKSDVLLASASKGFILGFNVRPVQEAVNEAKSRGIEIRTYDIIFELIDEIERLLKGAQTKETKEVVIGRVTVKQTFKVPNVGTVAGCLVADGKIYRGAKVKVIRNNAVIYTTEVSSLKRFKEDVREVVKGYECGVGLKNFNDIKVGDEFEVVEVQEV
ncbi:translation initiation factor IF-2 [Caldisericum exile]|uniref:Translation initiation factor IF-2 n=1 Tax=Caldisericum exile (strain DSM 21853 / NBRC 104410 / AZM16c01) TaxID=511051 RepID=A0A7U6JF57_CALEA|nr:translation initiation factor IF-2 [Caldisericum exile]BAL81426.1 translation initiation factor IF-2 [Caldisericum exile AZM16c01]